MKNIHLSKITPIAKGFRVYLGNGYSFHFNSLKSARSFLVATNTFLTFSLVEINSFYKDIFTRYRDNWLLFHHNKPSFKGRNHLDALKCETMLRDVADLLDHAFISSGYYENGSTWVFVDLIKSIDTLENVSLILLSYHKKRSETAAIYEIRNYLKRLVDLKNEINNYGHLMATGKHTKVVELKKEIEMIPIIEQVKKSC